MSVSVPYVHRPTKHCSVEYGLVATGDYRDLQRFSLAVDEDLLYIKWSTEDWNTLFDTPHELLVAAACLCAGLMPPSVFADLLEDHRPDLAEAAAFLREWEQVHKEQQK